MLRRHGEDIGSGFQVSGHVIERLSSCPEFADLIDIRVPDVPAYMIVPPQHRIKFYSMMICKLSSPDDLLPLAVPILRLPGKEAVRRLRPKLHRRGQTVEDVVALGCADSENGMPIIAEARVCHG